MASGTTAWATREIWEVEKALDTDHVNGLAHGHVEKRRQRSGQNVLEAQREETLLQKIIKQFKSPLVLILLGAGIATLFLQEFLDTIVIFVALLINVVIGVFQEERASRAFEKLNESQEKFATVIRDGKKSVIDARELVPGDVVIIEGGSYVPADIRLFEAKELTINESALTGEWVSVSKNTELVPENAPVADQSNVAWMGTLVVAGYGRGIVVETGVSTQVGKIARHLGGAEQRDTPLQANIKRLAQFLVYALSIIILIIFALGLFRGEPFGEMLLISIAVAVATIPAGLPAAVTVVLALGMESILRLGGLVRNLLAAETLGGTTIILTDKTGTLTEARMQLQSICTLESFSHGDAGGNGTQQWSEDERTALEAAVLASSAFVEGEGDDPSQLTVRGRPMERAIVAAGLAAGISQRSLRGEHRRLDLVQFESVRRYAASLNRYPKGKTNRLYVNGAPELLIERATAVLDAHKVSRFKKEKKRRFLDEMERLAGEGKRVIAVAYRSVPWDSFAEVSSGERKKDPRLEKLTFIGLLVFSDPVRADVVGAIKTVRDAHARVVMLTGDNPQTAFSIAKESDIAAKGDPVYTGTDIDAMDDEELYKALSTSNVFARVLPEQKLRIARILKNKKEVVAMTGDGVNDAPALRSADIGVVVGSGTEVAKEASDLILLNNSFSIIVSAIREGRKIIDNLKKIVTYLLSTSFSEVFVIGAAIIAGTPLPLLPSQILWANIVEEGLMSFAFAFERPEPGSMKRDPRAHRAKNILTPDLKKLLITIALVTSILLIVLYFVLLSLELPIERIRTLMFIALSIDSIFFAFSLKNLHLPVWKINFFDNYYLLVSLAVSFGLLLAAVTLSPLQTLLSLEPLSLATGGFLLLVGIANLSIIEIAKYFLFVRRGKTL